MSVCIYIYRGFMLSLFLSLQESLQKDFGTKTGDMLWNYCRGVDHRVVGVIQVSKYWFCLTLTSYG